MIRIICWMTDWLCFTSAKSCMLPRPVKAHKSNLQTFKKNKSHDVLGSSKEKTRHRCLALVQKILRSWPTLRNGSLLHTTWQQGPHLLVHLFTWGPWFRNASSFEGSDFVISVLSKYLGIPDSVMKLHRSITKSLVFSNPGWMIEILYLVWDLREVDFVIALSHVDREHMIL